MNLKNLKSLFIDNGCDEIFVKRLSSNDNSKNQVYFGGNFEILNVLPVAKITTVEAGDWKRERFKATLDFYWISEEGILSPAPHAQLILYPKYPEVRFSGFLLASKNAPSELMTQRTADRVLLLSVSRTGKVLGYVSHPNSVISKEINQEVLAREFGVFSVIELPQGANSRSVLLDELARINRLGWINSKRLDSTGNVLPCKSPNCGGYTLEAELGITPNGYSEPDFMGWEIKQFGVSKFENFNSSVITLMTPEPTGGIYKTHGVEYFIRNYGYMDKMGRTDRMNFGGVHKVGEVHKSTKLEMKLVGFDTESGKIRNSTGCIILEDESGNEAASWDFSSMLLHWNRKHDRACYVPSLSQRAIDRKYRYGNNIILGEGTDFQLFLSQMASGNIYYDPGIKMENVSVKAKIKKRSQFRIKSKYLASLYNQSEIVDVSK